jgi:Na+-driven multidrug efflux pump
MSANAISNQFDGVIYTVGAAIASATSVIVAQNYGAHNIERIKKAILIGGTYATSISLLLGSVFVIFADPMLRILSDSESVVAIAKDKMIFLCLTYFVTSIMEVFSFSLRAMGYNGCTFVVGVLCGFFIRSAWVWFVWEPLGKGLGTLYYAYPVSAGSAVLIYTVYYYFFAFKGVRKRLREEKDVCG